MHQIEILRQNAPVEVFEDIWRILNAIPALKQPVQ
jgi:hypothetical protein